MDGERAYRPRGLCLEEAAHYVGLSPNTFTEEVKNKRLPKPLEFGRRRVWDKKALDIALDHLSKLEQPTLGRWGNVGAHAIRSQKA